MGELSSESKESYQPEGSAPSKFDQKELKALVRGSRLPKDAAELLASGLKGRNLLALATARKITQNK